MSRRRGLMYALLAVLGFALAGFGVISAYASTNPTTPLEWGLMVSGGLIAAISVIKNLIGIADSVAKKKAPPATPPPPVQNTSTGGDGSTNIVGDVGGDVNTTTNTATTTGPGAPSFAGLHVEGDFVYNPTDGPSAAGQTTTAIPRIPPPVTDFTGRETDLATLLAHASTSGVAICGLQGMGGVGKTELAKVLAQRLDGQYPDGGLIVNLRGFSQDTAGYGEPPLAAGVALTQLLRQLLGADTALPQDLTQLQAAWASVLQGKKMLVLLDNARDAKQVAPLLPPAPSLAIVTSRNRIVLPSLKMVELDTLPLDQAVDFLLGICPRLKGQAEAVAQACGCLPLALRLAGSALQEDVTLSVERYLVALGQQEGRVRLAEPALGASYNLLSPELQERWCHLAVFPADFDENGAAAVWSLTEDQTTGFPELPADAPAELAKLLAKLVAQQCGPATASEDARAALGALVRQSLVQYDMESQRYRLHDLARDYATHRACGENADALEPTRLRHAWHYMRVLAGSQARYLEGGEGVLEGLALFDREWPNIEAGQAWAAAHAEDCGEAAHLCDLFPGVGGEILPLRQHTADQIAWQTTALAAARALGERSHEGIHLGNLGLAYADQGELDKAIECHEQALVSDRAIGDRRGEGADLGNLGNVYSRQNDLDKAIETYEKCLVIHREIGDRRGEGQALGNLGLAYARQGELDKAIESYEGQLEITREIGDRRGGGNALGNLGSVYYRQNDLDKAIETYEQALEIIREIGDRGAEGSILGNLGNAYSALEQRERAVEYYGQALEIAVELGDRMGEANDHYNLADEMVLLGQPDAAREHYQASLALWEAMGLENDAEDARRRLAALDA